MQNKVETKGIRARESETMLRESEGGEQKIVRVSGTRTEETGNRSVSAESHENRAGGLTLTVNVYRTVTNVQINCS
jgi:hypothetical protein